MNMTPHEQSADKLADRLADAAEAVQATFSAHEIVCLDCDGTDDIYCDCGKRALNKLQQALAAYRASPKEPNLLASKTADSREITDTQRPVRAAKLCLEMASL